MFKQLQIIKNTERRLRLSSKKTRIGHIDGGFHPRTLRNARLQVQQMVASGVSPRLIKRYLLAWCSWWVRTAVSWTEQSLLNWFLNACWEQSMRAQMLELLGQPVQVVPTECCTRQLQAAVTQGLLRVV